MKRTVWYIGLGNYCGLSSESKSEILRRNGTDNVTELRPATQDDVNNIRAMGGRVPDEWKEMK